MEIKLRIQSRQRGRYLYGLLTCPPRSTKKVIIVVHGMTGWMNDGKNRACAKFFTKRGWATLRFDLYGYQDDAGTFDKLGMRDNAADINTMVSHCKKLGFNSICLAGHSLGWPNILLANLKGVKAIISWDGPDPDSLRDVRSFGKYNAAVGGYIVDWGTRHIIGRKLTQELRKFPTAKSLVGGVKTPMLVIAAGDGPYHGAARIYCESTDGPNKFLEIPGASHNFAEEGKEEVLIRETFAWCRKWGS
ncbi:MAG: alpha/beta hydrolase [Deltaproteobacteria bacterium]|nr:alpha/beta hydrolase [Deltaproteobacteria bacterium]